MNMTKNHSVKLFAAVAGGAAVVSLGALGVIGQAESTSVATSTMNVGATVTETTPPTAPATSMAIPALKGDTPPLGFATTH